MHKADDQGRTPLHEAARHRSLFSVCNLLRNVANPYARDFNRVTPLHDAMGAILLANVLRANGFHNDK